MLSEENDATGQASRLASVERPQGRKKFGAAAT
jgi:hypothetical protein